MEKEKVKKVVDRYIILSYNSIETQYMVFNRRETRRSTTGRSFFVRNAY